MRFVALRLAKSLAEYALEAAAEPEGAVAGSAAQPTINSKIKTRGYSARFFATGMFQTPPRERSLGKWNDCHLGGAGRNHAVGSGVKPLMSSSNDRNVRYVAPPDRLRQRAIGTIILNILVALRQRLRSGRPCNVFVNDIKVQLHVAGESLFYYPDVW
jgi:hypothetical protein